MMLYFRLILNISLVESWDCGFWVIWTQTPFSWLWLLEQVRGALPPPGFNQIQSDIYPFLTPGSDKAHWCQFRLGHIPDLDESFGSDSSPSSSSVGSLWLCFSHLMRGRLPSHKPKPWTRALPWDHSHGRGPGSASGKGTALAVSVRRQCWRLASRQSLQHSISTKTK